MGTLVVLRRPTVIVSKRSTLLEFESWSHELGIHFIRKLNFLLSCLETSKSRTNSSKNLLPGRGGLRRSLINWIPFSYQSSQNKYCLVLDLMFLLTLTPSPPFSFLAYLLGKGGVKKWGFPLGFEPGTPRTTMHCSPMARHPGVAARGAISFPYETRFYDVIGLSAFSSLPLVGFCWTVDG